MDDGELQRRVGKTLCGKWTLERLLGSGGMAAVYVGTHKIGRRDAIKILHPEIARQSELRARFEQEAGAVNRFVHPGAVEIRDIDTTEDGCPFLVMELLEGESLAARAARIGTMEVGEVLRLVDELLDVLAAAHAHGIIHRDIKPDNLFCQRDGRLKVLDFGVARVKQAASSIQTRTGTTLGTVLYMPPEQVLGAHVDARADVFAVGATMFQLIAKRYIHQARSDSDLIVKMASVPAPALASVAPQAPPGVCAIVDRALAFDRDNRYPSAATMQQDVRAVRSGQPPSFALAFTAKPSGDATKVSNPHLSTAPTVAAAAGVPDPNAATRVEAARTTAPGKQLRWAALAFPLLGAAIVAFVYYRAVHVDRVDASAVASATAKPAATARSTPSGTRTATAATDKDRSKVRVPTTLRPLGPGNGKPVPPSNSCLTRDDCHHRCDQSCEVACTALGSCQIGALDNARVTCTGLFPCEVWCAGDCAVNCGNGVPCIVHCTDPGAVCEIDGCPQGVEGCQGDAIACGARCPE
jgi:serine/threonine-protein kinase